MLASSYLFRLFLSLVLVLNGIAGAVAGTRMHLASGPSQAVAHDVKSSVACHGKDAVANSGSQEHAGHPVPVTPDKTPAPDCCKGNLCSCACMVASQAMVAAIVLPEVRWNVLPIPSRMQVGHPNPALPHLIRPPIG